MCRLRGRSSIKLRSTLRSHCPNCEQKPQGQGSGLTQQGSLADGHPPSRPTTSQGAMSPRSLRSLRAVRYLPVYSLSNPFAQKEPLSKRCCPDWETLVRSRRQHTLRHPLIVRPRERNTMKAAQRRIPPRTEGLQARFVATEFRRYCGQGTNRAFDRLFFY